MALTLNNPSSFSHTVTGPSSIAVPLLNAHSEASLPITTGAPKLPNVIRSIYCVASGSLTVQTANGVTFVLTMTTGGVFKECYVVAVLGVTSGQFVGFV